MPLPASTYPAALRPRVIKGLTHRQSIALRKLYALKQEFAEKASLIHANEMERIADEGYRLIRVHFPESYPSLVAKLEARPLAV